MTDNTQHILRWAMFQHGDHIMDGCPVAEALVQLCLNEIMIEDFLDILEEADEEWEESFGQYMNMVNEQRKADLN